MASIETLISACQLQVNELETLAQSHIVLWERWLQPIADREPVGEEPGYDDDFQQIREEVNKISGADTERILVLAEKLLTATAKDIRVATYYVWARLHRDGEAGLADGLALLAGLIQRYGVQLHPQRERSRIAALEWLCSSRILDSLSRYPEVTKEGTGRIAAALWAIEKRLADRESKERPQLNSLYAALESRVLKSGGMDALVPQSVGEPPRTASVSGEVPALKDISSGQELLAQARTLAQYLRNQPDGWLAAHRLIKIFVTTPYTSYRC